MSQIEPTKTKRAAEFFAGIGLMRMGLDRCGWKTVWANDCDPKKLEMYSANFEDYAEEFVLEDVHKIESSSLPEIELATASFPCTDLSLAGSRRGLSGTQSSAFWGFMRVIENMGGKRPPLILLENVTGFLSSHGGSDFHEALTALCSLGYSVDALVIDAVRFVPQSRQRLFVIATKLPPSSSLKDQSPSLLQSDVRPASLADFIFLHPEINWSIREMPLLPTPTRKLCEIVEKIPEESQLWWSSERSEYLLNQMSAKHREIADGMIASPRMSFGTVFRRVRNGVSMAELRTDGTAGCLRTPKGGSGRQILFCAGKGKYSVRLLTPRECARLMGADDYKIDVSLNQALFGFGDAVCVPVVEWIAANYLNPALVELTRHEITSLAQLNKIRYPVKKRIAKVKI